MTVQIGFSASKSGDSGTYFDIIVRPPAKSAQYRPTFVEQERRVEKDMDDAFQEALSKVFVGVSGSFPCIPSMHIAVFYAVSSLSDAYSFHPMFAN